MEPHICGERYHQLFDSTPCYITVQNRDFDVVDFNRRFEDDFGVPEGRKCFEAYGVPGSARFRISFSGDGDVIGLRQKGDFVDTPTGKCIAKAVKAVKFAKSRRSQTTVDYPFILR